MATYEQLSGHGAPSNKTVGKVGQEYLDLKTGKVYVCVSVFSCKGYKITKSSYTWREKELEMDDFATDEEIAAAISNLKEEISGGGTVSEGIPVYAELVD